MYDKAVKRTRLLVDELLDVDTEDINLWDRVRATYWERVNDTSNGEFSKTFFNSVHRDFLRSMSINPSQISDTANIVSSKTTTDTTIDKIDYLVWQNLPLIVERIVSNFKFDAEHSDLQGDIDFVFSNIMTLLDNNDLEERDIRRIEILNSFFFQSGRAFLVGKIICNSKIKHPLILAYVNRPEGLSIEAVLTDENDVSTLFGFSRSYFMVDLEPIEGVVNFINSILPSKPIDEIYTILGRTRQGKTERARALESYMKSSSDKFRHAPGIRGMVMSVFTLPGYSLVFKVIKDDFGHTKSISREEVKQKYKLVFHHDRAGRLIDSQEFRNIEFPIERFEKEILEDLLTYASRTVRIVEKNVIIDHLYTERKLIPLDVYLRESDIEQSTRAVIDYGQAIKDLALTNIFPGDFLLKNFGVSRQGRVIFYDYDELCLTTDCNFRNIPPHKHKEDEIRPNDWFYVHKNDIFPEEFINFLALEPRVKEAFLEKHDEILTVDYWQQINNLHLTKKAPEVTPYSELKKN